MLQMFGVKQSFPSNSINDIPGAVNSALERLRLAEMVKPGESVAITVGSRGINNIVTILQTVVGRFKKLGARPKLVACMGSHGGGTAEGMRAVLKGLGITEQTIAASVIAEDEAVALGKTGSGLNIYCFRELSEADHVLVLNRVKPHTCFHWEHESGLLKMLSVGVGGVKGAETVHSLGPGMMAKAIYEIADGILHHLSMLGGLGIVETSSDETAVIEGLLPREIVSGDKQLLAQAKKMLARLPVEKLDFLVAREMGKDFSGTGMDVNVTGRWGLEDLPDPPLPDIKRLGVLDLSEASHGNANGIGLADFTTKKLFQKINFQATYLNGFTTNLLARIKLPVILDSDREVWHRGLASLRTERVPRVIIINNTLQLDRMLVSKPVADEICHNTNIEVGGTANILSFDSQGNLTTIID